MITGSRIEAIFSVTENSIFKLETILEGLSYPRYKKVYGKQ